MSEVAEELLGICRDLFGLRPTDEARLVAHASARARHLSVELEDYLARLAEDEDEQAVLAVVATNGWTWFWRESSSLRLACERLRERSLRRAHAWVAGCSTGEEAFTLAMIAEESGLDLRILATDVDASRIAHARRGRYELAAMRHLPIEVRERFFERTADGGFRVRDELGSRVRFEVHNLLAAPPPSPIGTWDLISCRNVLLHADGPAAARMLENLGAVLDPLGQRVLSAADELAVEASRVSHRRCSMPPPAAPAASGSTAPAPPPPRPAPSPPPDPVRSAAARFEVGDRAGAERALRTAIDEDARSFEAHLALGNLLVATHRFDEAERVYASAEALDPQSTELLVMLGILHRKMGRRAEAEAALRRAVFLERHLWLAWLLLAGIHEREGQQALAARALDAASQALALRPRLSWRTPDFGVADRRLDPEDAERLCTTRIAGRGRAGGAR